jgi:hypothetical protein
MIDIANMDAIDVHVHAAVAGLLRLTPVPRVR